MIVLINEKGDMFKCEVTSLVSIAPKLLTDYIELAKDVRVVIRPAFHRVGISCTTSSLYVKS